MTRFVPTRSIATVGMAFLLCGTLAIAILVPVEGVRPTTVGYIAMLATGLGMFLRRRVFANAVR